MKLHSWSKKSPLIIFKMPKLLNNCRLRSNSEIRFMFTHIKWKGYSKLMIPLIYYDLEYVGEKCLFYQEYNYIIQYRVEIYGRSSCYRIIEKYYSLQLVKIIYVTFVFLAFWKVGNLVCMIFLSKLMLTFCKLILCVKWFFHS